MEKIKFEVRCHEWGDGSDYLIETFDTKQEAQACIDLRDKERPGDALFEHWYITPVVKEKSRNSFD